MQGPLSATAAAAWLKIEGGSPLCKQHLVESMEAPPRAVVSQPEPVGVAVATTGEYPWVSVGSLRDRTCDRSPCSSGDIAESDGDLLSPQHHRLVECAAPATAASPTPVLSPSATTSAHGNASCDAAARTLSPTRLVCPTAFAPQHYRREVGGSGMSAEPAGWTSPGGDAGAARRASLPSTIASDADVSFTASDGHDFVLMSPAKSAVEEGPEAVGAAISGSPPAGGAPSMSPRRTCVDPACAALRAQVRSLQEDAHGLEASNASLRAVVASLQRELDDAKTVAATAAATAAAHATESHHAELAHARHAAQAAFEESAALRVELQRLEDIWQQSIQELDAAVAARDATLEDVQAVTLQLETSTQQQAAMAENVAAMARELARGEQGAEAAREEIVRLQEELEQLRAASVREVSPAASQRSGSEERLAEELKSIRALGDARIRAEQDRAAIAIRSAEDAWERRLRDATAATEARMEGELNALREANAKLTRDYAATHMALRAVGSPGAHTHDASSDGLHHQLREREGIIEQLRTQLAALEAELCDVRSAHRPQVEALEGRIARLTDQMASLNAALLGAVGDREKVKKDANDATVAHLTAVERENAQLRGTCRQMESIIEALEARVAQERALHEAAAKLAAERGGALGTRGATTTTATTAAVDTLRTSLAASERERAALMEDGHVRERNMLYLEREAAACREYADHIASLYDLCLVSTGLRVADLSAHVNDTTFECQQFQAALTTARCNVGYLQDELASRDARLAALTDKVARQELSLRDVRGDLERQANLVADKDNLLRRLQDASNAAQRALAGQDAEAVALRAAVTALEAAKEEAHAQHGQEVHALREKASYAAAHAALVLEEAEARADIVRTEASGHTDTLQGAVHALTGLEGVAQERVAATSEQWYTIKDELWSFVRAKLVAEEQGMRVQIRQQGEVARQALQIKMLQMHPPTPPPTSQFCRSAVNASSSACAMTSEATSTGSLHTVGSAGAQSVGPALSQSRLQLPTSHPCPQSDGPTQYIHVARPRSPAAVLAGMRLAGSARGPTTNAAAPMSSYVSSHTRHPPGPPPSATSAVSPPPSPQGTAAVAAAFAQPPSWRAAPIAVAATAAGVPSHLPDRPRYGSVSATMSCGSAFSTISESASPPALRRL